MINKEVSILISLISVEKIIFSLDVKNDCFGVTSIFSVSEEGGFELNSAIPNAEITLVFLGSGGMLGKKIKKIIQKREVFFRQKFHLFEHPENSFEKDSFLDG